MVDDERGGGGGKIFSTKKMTMGHAEREIDTVHVVYEC